MANTSTRTLRLLSLLQARRYWPGAELAARLQVSPRTLRRDVDRLRELGYPIQAQRGVEGGYQLAAGTALPPLVVDDEEAVALAVGLQAAAQGAVEGIAESSDAGAGQGGAGHAGPAAAPGRGAERDDGPRQLGTAGRPGERRSGHPHHRRPGLPGQRTAALLLHRGRRPAHRPARGTAPPGPARPPLVPGRLRPHPARLAQLPARPARPRRAAPGQRSGRASCPPPTPPLSSGPASPASPPRTTWRSWSRPRPRTYASGSASGARCEDAGAGPAAGCA